MKREILYKAQRADGKGWVRGLPVKDSYSKWFIESLSGTHIYTHKILPETLCQFTGLTDKNGVKIFEGDTVEFTDFRGIYNTKQSKNDGYIRGWIGVIEWRNYNGWYLNKDNDHNNSMLEPIGKEVDKRDNIYIYSNSNIEKTNPIITGNIHDKNQQS